MKSIFIIGCYHSLNSGVMAMAESIIQNFSDQSIYVLTSSKYRKIDEERYSIYRNVKLVEAEWLLGNRYNKILSIFTSIVFGSVYKQFNKAVSDSDIIIDISGDSISSDYGSMSMFLSLLPNFLINKRKKELIYAPQTVGPFQTRFQKVIANIAFKNKNVKLFLRESYSAKFLEDIGIKNYEILADLAFLLESRKLEISANFNIDHNTISVGVSSLVKKFGVSESTILFKKVVDACLFKGYKVLLITHVSTEHGNDIEVAKELKQKYYNGNDKVLFIGENFRASEWKYVISQSRAIVTARMHPAVLALSLAIPALNLSYNHKSLGVIKEAFEPYGDIIDINSPSLIDVINSFLDRLEFIDQNHFNEKVQINKDKSLQFINSL